MNNDLYEFQTLVYRIKTLIKEARNNNIEVIYVRHDDGVGQKLTKGAAGYEIYENFSQCQMSVFLIKCKQCFFEIQGCWSTCIEKGTNTIIIVGLQTDYCIDATVKCGFEHGLKNDCSSKYKQYV